MIMLLSVLLLLIAASVTNARSYKDLPQECFTFSEMLDKARNWDARPATSNSHDETLQPGWYRVLGDAGNSLKEGYEQTAVGSNDLPNFCGTQFSGTLMGSHPTVEEGILPMTVCFRPAHCMIKGTGSCKCRGERTIYVRNCATYFVYWLTPTTGKQRYCTSSTYTTGPKVVNGLSQALECTQHHTIDDESREWDRLGEPVCDSDKQGWYRFTGDSYSEIASTCQAQPMQHRLSQRCAAKFRGYVVDKHPTVQEGRVERRVCFSYSDSCTCEFYSNIGIRNCGKYYVYRLSGSPTCDSRYCAAKKNETASATDRKKHNVPSPKEDMCAMYKVLHDADRLWSYTNPTVSKCDSALYGKYRFGSLYTPWKVKEGCKQKDLDIMSHRCGANLLGYMVESHPSKKDGVVDRIICYTSGEKPCQCVTTNVIKVQNCGDYYVYKFKSVPSCSSRLCMVANNSEAIEIDPSKSPDFEIPLPDQPVYTPVIKEVQTEDNRNLIVSTTVLALLLFIFTVLIIVIILIFLLVIRKRKQKESGYTSTDGAPVPKPKKSKKTEQRTLDVPVEQNPPAENHEERLGSTQKKHSLQPSEASSDNYESPNSTGRLMPNGASPSAPVEDVDSAEIDAEIAAMQRDLEERNAELDDSNECNTLLRPGDEHKPTPYEEATNDTTV